MADDDAQHFLEHVDEVSRLIAGLKAGTLPPEHLDRNLTSCGYPSDTTRRDAGKHAAPQDEARREELQRKAQELKIDYERKIRARQRFEAYVGSGKQQQHRFGTDYARWDLWCPEDETDELISSIANSNPALRAMEKDVDERHRRWALLACARGAAPPGQLLLITSQPTR